MPTVTINAVDYDVYADLDTADEFLAADFSADAWRAETVVDQKARADVTATRLLDRIRWAGEKTDPDQLHAFPRTGITGLDEDTVPQPIIDASIVLAKLIHAGSSVDSQPSTQSGNIRRQQAGSVSIEYFFPLDDPTRLPVEIEELIAPYLATAAFGSLAFGTCGRSITDCDHSFEPGWPPV
jgi:hypothetical protein